MILNLGNEKPLDLAGITQCKPREFPLGIGCSRPVQCNVVATAREGLPSPEPLTGGKLTGDNRGSPSQPSKGPGHRGPGWGLEKSALLNLHF